MTTSQTQNSSRVLLVLLCVGLTVGIVGTGVTIKTLVDNPDNFCTLISCSVIAGSTAYWDAGDGRVGVEVGPVGGPQITEISLLRGVHPHTQYNNPLWKVERVDPTPEWNGSFVIGETPPGFIEVVPFPGRLPHDWALMTTNGCYGGASDRPDEELRTDQVRYPGGSLSTFEEFRESALEFQPCEDPRTRTTAFALLSTMAGFALAFGGALGLGFMRVNNRHNETIEKFGNPVI